MQRGVVCDASAKCMHCAERTPLREAGAGGSGGDDAQHSMRCECVRGRGRTATRAHRGHASRHGRILCMAAALSATRALMCNAQ